MIDNNDDNFVLYIVMQKKMSWHANRAGYFTKIYWAQESKILVKHWQESAVYNT